MKDYKVSEKQIEELKRIHERCIESRPTAFRGYLGCEDVDDLRDGIGEMQDAIDKSREKQAECFRELKFLIEDIERQEIEHNGDFTAHQER